MGISHLLRSCIFCGKTSLSLQYTNELCDEHFVDRAVRPSTEEAPLRSFMQLNNTQIPYLEEKKFVIDGALTPVQRREVRYTHSLPDRQNPRPTVHLPIAASSQLRALWGNALGDGGRGALLNLQRACDMMATLVPASFVCVDVMGADHHVSCTLAVAGTEEAEAALPLGQPRVRTGRESNERTIRLPLSSWSAHPSVVCIDTAASAGGGGGGSRVSGSLQHRGFQIMSQDSDVSNIILSTISSTASVGISAGRAHRTAAAATATLPLTAPHHSTSSGFPRSAAHPPLTSRNTASADGTPPPHTPMSPSASTPITSLPIHSPWRRRIRTPLPRASLTSLPNQRVSRQCLSTEATTPRQQRSLGNPGGAMSWALNERSSCPPPPTNNIPKYSLRGSAAISDRGVAGGNYRNSAGGRASGDSSGGDIAACLEFLPPHIRGMVELYGDTISSIWAVPLYDVPEVTNAEEGMSAPRSSGSAWYGAGATAVAATEAEIEAQVQAAVAAAASDRGKVAGGDYCPERHVIGVLYMFGSTQALFCPTDRSRFRAAVSELSSYVTEGCLQLLPDLGHRLELARDPRVAAEVAAAALGAVFTHRMKGMGRVRVYPAFLRQHNPTHNLTDQTRASHNQDSKHPSGAVTQPYRLAPHHAASSSSSPLPSTQTAAPTRDLILMLPPAAATPPPSGQLPPAGAPPADPRQQDKVPAPEHSPGDPAVISAIPSNIIQPPSSVAPARMVGTKSGISAVGAVMRSRSDAVGQEIGTCSDGCISSVVVVDTRTAVAAEAAFYGERSSSAASIGAVGSGGGGGAAPAIQRSATSAYFASLGFPLSQFTSESYDGRTSGDASDSSYVRGSESFRAVAPPQPCALAAEGTLMAVAAAAARSRACRGMMLHVSTPQRLTTTATSAATARTQPLRGGSILTAALTADLDIRLGAVGTAMWEALPESPRCGTQAGDMMSTLIVPPQSSRVRADGRDAAAAVVVPKVALRTPEDVRQLPGQPYHVLAGVVRTAEGTSAEGATALWPGVYLTFSESLRPELVRELQTSLDALLLLIGGALLTACASETSTHD